MTIHWPKKGLLTVLLFGLGSGLVGTLITLSPWGEWTEERFGLDWLFHLRGPLEPPQEVVVVAINKQASDRLGVPYDTTEWSRALHTRLLEGLRQAGARQVTFDLLFRNPRDAEDRELARAIMDFEHVALLEFLLKDQPGAVRQAGQAVPVTLQRRLPPTPQLARAAAGLGPFTLPKVPDRVSRFWTFDENAGGVASLPLVALTQYLAPEYRRLREQLAAHAPGFAQQFPSSLVEFVTERAPHEGADLLSVMLERAAQSDPDRAAAHDDLYRLLGVLRSPVSRYLNFYGPPQTLHTVDYADALELLAAEEGRERFSDKAVFVGVSSPVQWHLQDEFLTVYSDPVSGLDLGGTEILATGFANLLDQNSIQPMSVAGMAVTLVIWSLWISVLGWFFRPLLALLLSLLASASYLILAVYAFGVYNLWLPVFVPLVILTPMILFSATVWQHREARDDLRRIRDTFGHYLPQATVDRLVQEGFDHLQDRRTVFGVCLITDAEGYTAIAEGMPSDKLVDLINDYLDVIIGPIQRFGGEVSDIKGDSVLAFWASRHEDRAIRAEACRAVDAIQQAIMRWNDDNAYDVSLPTRIGLHCGSMTLASVGAADHYEQRAVGDIVNTASRLEQLNKELGTRMLVSGETIQGVEGVATRDLGTFTLKGRAQPIEVHELLGWDGEAGSD